MFNRKIKRALSNLEDRLYNTNSILSNLLTDKYKGKTAKYIFKGKIVKFKIEVVTGPRYTWRGYTEDVVLWGDSWESEEYGTKYKTQRKLKDCSIS